MQIWLFGPWLMIDSACIIYKRTASLCCSYSFLVDWLQRGMMEFHVLLFLGTSWQSTEGWGRHWDSGRHNRGEYQSDAGSCLNGGAKKWRGRVRLLVGRLSGWEQAHATQQSTIKFSSIVAPIFAWLLGVCMEKARVPGRGMHLAGGMESAAYNLTTSHETVELEILEGRVFLWYWWGCCGWSHWRQQ